MDVIYIFAIIAGITFLGFIAEIIFKRTNIPDVLILMGVGILLSFGFSIVSADSFGEGAKLFTTFALIFILFQGALSIDFKNLFSSLPKTLSLTVLSFILTVTFVSGVSYLIYGDILISLLIGMVLGGTSSAVVIPMVNNLEISEKNRLVLTLESAISDVLVIVGALTILQIMETGSVEASNIFQTILTSFSLAIVVGVIIGIIWIVLLHKFDLLAKTHVVTIALVIGIYSFVESPFVEASGAIAALAFGLMLGNSRTILLLTNGKKSRRRLLEGEVEPESRVIRSVLSGNAKSFYSEISFFVKIFFFVYLGILMDFSNPWLFVYAVFITLAAFLVRPYAVKFVYRKDRTFDDLNRTILEIMIPKGLAAAVIAGLAVQSGLLGDVAGEFVSLILSVVLLSIVFTSVLVFLADKGWFKGFLPFLYTNGNGKKK